MRKLTFIAVSLLCLASMAARAQSTAATPESSPNDVQIIPDDDGNASHADQSGVSSQDGGIGQEDTNTTLHKAPSRGSLLDLKDEQDKADQSSENAPLPGVGKKGFCASRDITASLQMPSKKQFMRPSGLDKEKFDKCKNSFESLEKACDPESTCDDCDKAVKDYTVSCGYVGSKGNQ